MAESEAKTPVDEMSFEEAMAALEAIVSKLEAGDVPLEDSITLYERGAALKAHCEARLQAAEARVAQITTGAEGAATGATPVETD
ncbi:MAG: exodeoxyribonuclease VII small subunit [Pseudomonadota bacterium]